MPFKNSNENLKKWHQEMIDLVNLRGHRLISGKMTKSQRDECYVVYCPLHNSNSITSFYNYKKAKTGCTHCGHASVSEQLTKREFSIETLEKMTASARSRPSRGGKERRWRETHDYRMWNSIVRREWNNECAITATKNVKPGDGLLDVHHLISASSTSSLILVIENGIVIHKKLHKAFHLKYGYKNNTVEQFMEFILKIKNNEIIVPISSQTESEGSGGSETRVYDPERIMELHERLSEIKDILKTVLADE